MFFGHAACKAIVSIVVFLWKDKGNLEFYGFLGCLWVGKLKVKSAAPLLSIRNATEISVD